MIFVLFNKQQDIISVMTFTFPEKKSLKKFSKLSENKAVIPSSTLRPGVINFSSRTLTLQEKSVFCFITNKVPVEEIISSIETSLHRNPILIKFLV